MNCGLAAELGELEPLIQQGNRVVFPYVDPPVGALRCRSCGYVRFPAPDSAFLRQYYTEVYPAASRDWYNYDVDYSAAKRNLRAQRIVDIAARFGHGAGSRVHETGCAFGGTVFELANRGYRATGTELNSGAVEEGRRRASTPIQSEADEAFLGRQAEKLDVLYGYYVLEHMVDPAAFLRSVAPYLAPHGVIAMMVPNAFALHPMVYGFSRYNWFSYPSHLHYFSPRSALCLAEKAGLRLLGVAARTFPVQPGATDAAIGPRKDSAMAAALHKEALEAAFLSDEIEMIFGLPSAEERFAEEIRFTRHFCENYTQVELDRRALGAASNIVAP